MIKFTILTSIFSLALLSVFLHPKAAMPLDVRYNDTLITRNAERNYTLYCAGCHGNKVEAFADRNWNHGKNRENLFRSIKLGYENGGMPSFTAAFTDEEIYDLSDYILKSIANVDRYTFTKLEKNVNFFESKHQNIILDTIGRNLGIPWSMAFLPGGEMLVTERSNKLYLLKKGRQPRLISGLPKVWVEMQGGLFDIKLHPKFEKNKLVYVSYAAYKIEGKDTLSTTAVVKARFDGFNLSKLVKIFEVLPYAKTRYHYGAKLEFDDHNNLYISVGDRGSSKISPQSTAKFEGKIHRIKDDGSIPLDNPFVQSIGSVKSVYSYGHRNPQGMAFHPVTRQLWANEHGPRGGDEINLIQKGRNYGWPVISYGINYDGKPFTDKTSLEGMEQPVNYWIPSIAPSGLAIVTGRKYKNWEGNILSGSLRFNYLNRTVIKGSKALEEEILLKDVGRLRDVRMGPDGYIYIATESPGYVFKLVPVN